MSCTVNGETDKNDYQRQEKIIYQEEEGQNVGVPPKGQSFT
jgi:hypothetical protein